MLPLKPSHIKFVEYYLIDGNATEAYHKAYPDSSICAASVSGHKLLKKTNIQDAIQKGREKLAKKILVTKEDIIKDLLDIKNLHKDGNSNQSSTSIKALELITKMLGFQTPTESTVTIKGEQPLFTDEHLKDNNE